MKWLACSHILASMPHSKLEGTGIGAERMTKDVRSMLAGFFTTGRRLACALLQSSCALLRELPASEGAKLLRCPAPASKIYTYLLSQQRC